MKTNDSFIDTIYSKNEVVYYGYPAGENTEFFNSVPPSIEEVVSARPLSFLKNNKVLVFDSTINNTSKRIMDLIGISIGENIIKFPQNITANIKGKERNDKIKDFLINTLKPGTLNMAQPYVDNSLNDLYSINSEIQYYLNNKLSMYEWIPKEYLPEIYKVINSGKEFETVKERNLCFPCFLKVTSSSAGDGTMLIKDKNDLLVAKGKFKGANCPIIFQEYIENIESVLSIYCGLDKNGNLKYFGTASSLNSENGESYGSNIQNKYQELGDDIKFFLYNILAPKLKKLGWYGLLCPDIILTDDGKLKFIDPNFRMGASIPFVMDKYNTNSEKNYLTFTGKFQGSESDFIKNITPLIIKENIFKILSITSKSNNFIFSSAILYDQEESKKENLKIIKKQGIITPY